MNNAFELKQIRELQEENKELRKLSSFLLILTQSSDEEILRMVKDVALHNKNPRKHVEEIVSKAEALDELEQWLEDERDAARSKKPDPSCVDNAEFEAQLIGLSAQAQLTLDKIQELRK